MAFADSLLAQRGISPQGLSADDKALALYREKAAGQLARMMAARNKALTDYMQSTHGATAPAFRVQTMDSPRPLHDRPRSGRRDREGRSGRRQRGSRN